MSDHSTTTEEEDVEVFVDPTEANNSQVSQDKLTNQGSRLTGLTNSNIDGKSGD
jgi:hypothetical protein